MRKGFSYINLLVYISLFLLLFSLVSSLFFPWLNKTFSTWQACAEQMELNRVVDTMVQDITYAQRAEVCGDIFIYQKEGINYEYLLKNQRIARKKESYIYLTNKNLIVQLFEPCLIKPGQFSLKIKTNNLEIYRIINRVN